MEIPTAIGLRTDQPHLFIHIHTDARTFRHIKRLQFYFYIRFEIVLARGRALGRLRRHFLATFASLDPMYRNTRSLHRNNVMWPLRWPIYP